MAPNPSPNPYTPEAIREIAFQAAGVGSGAVMRLAPTVVMPSETIIEGVEKILADWALPLPLRWERFGMMTPPRIWRGLRHRHQAMCEKYGWRAAWLDRLYLATRWEWPENMALRIARREDERRSLHR